MLPNSKDRDEISAEASSGAFIHIEVTESQQTLRQQNDRCTVNSSHATICLAIRYPAAPQPQSLTRLAPRTWTGLFGRLDTMTICHSPCLIDPKMTTYRTSEYRQTFVSCGKDHASTSVGTTLAVARTTEIHDEVDPKGELEVG